MFECLTKINWKKVGLFASGTLFGTAGIKALASDDAKKLYTNCTAAVLRAKETVMNTVTTVQENAEDIYEGACRSKSCSRICRRSRSGRRNRRRNNRRSWGRSSRGSCRIVLTIWMKS